MSETETVLTEQELDAVRRAREAADAMPLASNAIGDVYAIVRRLDAELVRLTSALPKTADGVVVVPGMMVYYRDTGRDGDPVARFCAHRVTRAGPQGADGGVPHILDRGYQRETEPIWSTEALAAAHRATVFQERAEQAHAAAEAAARKDGE